MVKKKLRKKLRKLARRVTYTPPPHVHRTSRNTELTSGRVPPVAQSVTVSSLPTNIAADCVTACDVGSTLCVEQHKPHNGFCHGHRVRQSISVVTRSQAVLESHRLWYAVG